MHATVHVGCAIHPILKALSQDLGVRQVMNRSSYEILSRIRPRNLDHGVLRAVKVSRA